MGKKGALSPCKKAEVKALVNAKLFSNREISRKLKVSEVSVRRIKKKIEPGEELSPKRKKKCGTKPISPQGQKDLLRKFALKTDLLPQKYDAARPVQDVLQNRLILQLEEWFPNGKPYIFMQDGAPCHTARSIKAFLAEQHIPLLDWLGNSPDMSPIENIWELMKREVAKDVITNKTQLLERIIHVWNHHPQMHETVQSCIDSMPRRIEALIAAKGGPTKY
ncbi:transposable element Tcb2 transposase [Trichonephila clavipes]|uniref:Transposable element Tcb2 transposase n=1 Tax=Trichonephila clavipes TaxID=2585209 RepID=A0A8X6R6D9_TRICX|nr:transposable element Tcb2 transposase [Trichonephila clavipes]